MWCSITIVSRLSSSTIFNSVVCNGPSWSWSLGSWIYNYLCTQYLSPLTLWVRISPRRYNIMYKIQYHLTQKKRHVLDITCFFFLMSTRVKAEVRSTKVVTWVRMRKKIPVISNTGNFLCFNNNVSNPLTCSIIALLKTQMIWYLIQPQHNSWFIDLYITNPLCI